MKDTSKTKRQLIDEMNALRKRIAGLESRAARAQREMERLKMNAETAERSTVGTAVVDLEGNPVGSIGTERDITARARADAALEASEKNCRNVVDHALVGIFRRNMGGDVFYVNQAFLDILEYDSLEELRAVPFVDAYEDPSERDRLIDELTKRGKVSGREIRLLTKTGRTRDVLVNATIEEGVMSGMVMDITERKAMEEELRQNEERHRALFEGSLDAILLTDPASGRVIDANPAASDLFSRSKTSMVGLHHGELYPSRLREELNGAFNRIVNERDQDFPEEATVLGRAGTETPVEVMAHLIQIDGRLVVYQVFRDISERKAAAEALQLAADRYRRLFDDSPVSLWEEDYSEVKRTIEQLRETGVLDFRGHFDTHPEAVEQCARLVRVVDVNEATLKMYEADTKEDFFSGLDQILTPQSYAVFREGLIALAEGKTFFEAESVNQTLKGRSMDIHVRWTVPKDAERTLYRLLVSVVDLTERKRMEQELGNIQRLQSLGVLAGGIAHDFNNLLTSVLANLSMAILYGDLDDEIGQMLADAEKASLRAQGLTQQLLTFAKGGEPIKKTLRLPALLKESAAFALSGSNTRCDDSIPDGLGLVDGDEGQLSQVFQNLVINADQAMPEGGVIRIRAEDVRIGKNQRGGLREGDYVKVSVEDQGGGIREDHLQKIFDPFFTTKERGRGLGLAIAFSVIHRHGGHIEVNSELGKGSAFQVYLPASRSAVLPEEAGGETFFEGEGRVLVIDDEEIVRTSAGAVLKRLGYEVSFAKTGTEGIEIYGQAMRRGRSFDAVIMDLTIPGERGGEETLKLLRDLDPGAKVIVSSGYAEDPVMSLCREYGFDGVLLKPYRVADLAQVVFRVLSER